MDGALVHERWSTAPVLQDVHATLEPLSLQHADGLRDALGDGALARCWYTNVPAPEQVDAYIRDALETCERLAEIPFAVRDRSGRLVGSTRFYDVDPVVPRVSVGYTWYAQFAQRTGVNTEAKLMLLDHAFETLACIRVAFETSSFNTASRAAIARLGARQEGILRNHRRHADGSPRDTVVFAITDTDWPVAKRNLQRRLEMHGNG